MTPQLGPDWAVSSPGNFLARLRLWAKDLAVDILIVAVFSTGNFCRGYLFFELCFFDVSLVEARASMRYPSAWPICYCGFHENVLILNGI